MYIKLDLWRIKVLPSVPLILYSILGPTAQSSIIEYSPLHAVLSLECMGRLGDPLPQSMLRLIPR